MKWFIDFLKASADSLLYIVITGGIMWVFSFLIWSLLGPLGIIILSIVIGALVTWNRRNKGWIKYD